MYIRNKNGNFVEISKLNDEEFELITGKKRDANVTRPVDDEVIKVADAESDDNKIVKRKKYTK